MRYDSLSDSRTLATGIVVHRQNPDGSMWDYDLNIIAYADSTDNPCAGNGVIYIGAFIPASGDATHPTVAFLPLPEMKADAIGHMALLPSSPPVRASVYYGGGAGWSKHDIPTPEYWMDLMQSFARRINSPLDVTVLTSSNK